MSFERKKYIAFAADILAADTRGGGCLPLPLLLPLSPQTVPRSLGVHSHRRGFTLVVEPRLQSRLGVGARVDPPEGFNDADVHRVVRFRIRAVSVAVAVAVAVAFYSPPSVSSGASSPASCAARCVVAAKRGDQRRRCRLPRVRRRK